MNHRQHLFLFLLLFVLGCTNKSNKEWRAALKEDNFEQYFRFAIDNPDFRLQNILFDTLTNKVISGNVSIIALSQYSGFPKNLDLKYLIQVYDPYEDPGLIYSNNAFEINISKDGSIFFEDSACNLYTLKDCLDEFYSNPERLDNLSSQEEISSELLGKVLVSKGMIGISGAHDDETTEYNIKWPEYIEIYGMIIDYFNERRNELAREHFNMEYKNLDQKRKEAIIEISSLLIWFII